MAHFETKDDYILHALSKIKHKKFELYVIAKVLFTLNDPDIEFICQQYVKSPNIAKRGYLVDLFFPQFHIYLKVNERFHLEQVEQDEIRDQEIIEVANIRPFEINEYANESNKYTLAQIDEHILEFCNLIKSLKKKLLAEQNFKPWAFGSRYDVENYIGRKSLGVKDNIIVRRQVDALRLFGVEYKGWQRAWWVRNENQAVWFPKLYELKNNAWDNSLSKDGLTIIERKKDGSMIDNSKNENMDRIVFAHSRNALNETVYKFIGIFRTSKEKSTPSINVHELVSDRVILEK